MVRRMHDHARKKGDKSPPISQTGYMMPYGGGKLVDDEELVALDLGRNLSTTDVSVSEVPSVEMRTEEFAEIMPPTSRMTLVAMEAHVTPPSLDVCHELLFEHKVDLQLRYFRLGGILTDRLKHEQDYWVALGMELANMGDLPKGGKMLPGLIDEIKAMLMHLYPASKLIHEHLKDFDSTFLIGQIQLGNTRAHDLASLLCTIIKANCAPKRDAILEHIMKLGQSGNWIDMFKLLLELMELMKLVCHYILDYC